MPSPSEPTRRAKKVLIVLHQERSSPGRVGQKLVQRGYALDIRKPRFGDPLPETLEDYAGAVIFGGPMSANDDEDYIQAETDWISVPLKEQAPFLGICLGAQMMVNTLGGRVFGYPDERAEIGYYEIEPTDAGRALVDWPEQVYQWHREGFDLPASATLLAKGGESFPNQAFRIGPAAFGIQFHAELTLAMMCRWTVHGAPRMVLPGAQGRRAHFDGRAVYDRHVVRWLDDFLDLWLASDARDRSAIEAA